jgi:polysaccharide export outer membrane protein
MERLIGSTLRRGLLGLALAGLVGGGLAAEKQATDRKLNAQDVVNIYIVGEKDLPIEYQVSSSGTIVFPFLGTVEVKDKTAAELGSLLKEDLAKDYFVDPQVIVSVKQYRRQFVNVFGHVNKPGQVELPVEKRFDIVDALAAAGGLNNLASKNKIRLTRKGKTDEYALDKLKEIKEPEKRVWLEEDDTVEIGASVL